MAWNNFSKVVSEITEGQNNKENMNVMIIVTGGERAASFYHGLSDGPVAAAIIKCAFLLMENPPNLKPGAKFISKAEIHAHLGDLIEAGK